MVLLFVPWRQGIKSYHNLHHGTILSNTAIPTTKPPVTTTPTTPAATTHPTTPAVTTHPTTPSTTTTSDTTSTIVMPTGNKGTVTWTYASFNAFNCLFMHVCVHACMFVYVCVCVYVSAHVHVYVCMYMCMHMCACKYTMHVFAC